MHRERREWCKTKLYVWTEGTQTCRQLTPSCKQWPWAQFSLQGINRLNKSSQQTELHTWFGQDTHKPNIYWHHPNSQLTVWAVTVCHGIFCPCFHPNLGCIFQVPPQHSCKGLNAPQGVKKWSLGKPQELQRWQKGRRPPQWIVSNTDLS